MSSDSSPDALFCIQPILSPEPFCQDFYMTQESILIYNPYAYGNATAFLDYILLGDSSSPVLLTYTPGQQTIETTNVLEDGSAYLFCFYNGAGEMNCQSMGRLWLWVMSLISFIACVLVLIRYFRIRARGTALTMILILSISDMISHFGMFWLWFLNLVDQDVLQNIIPWFKFIAFGQFFSMFWSPFIARYVYKVLTTSRFRDSRQELIIPIVITFVISTGFLIWLNPHPPDSWQVSLDQSMYGFIFINLTLLISTVYYIKSVLYLRKLQQPFKDAVRPWIRSLLMYAFAQLLSEGPYMMICLYGTVAAQGSPIPYNTGMNIIVTAGFANAIVFLTQSQEALDRPREEEIRRRDSQLRLLNI